MIKLKFLFLLGFVFNPNLLVNCSYGNRSLFFLSSIFNAEAEVIDGAVYLLRVRDPFRKGLYEFGGEIRTGSEFIVKDKNGDTDSVFKKVLSGLNLIEKVNSGLGQMTSGSSGMRFNGDEVLTETEIEQVLRLILEDSVLKLKNLGFDDLDNGHKIVCLSMYRYMPVFVRCNFELIKNVVDLRTAFELLLSLFAVHVASGCLYGYMIRGFQEIACLLNEDERQNLNLLFEAFQNKRELIWQEEVPKNKRRMDMTLNEFRNLVISDDGVNCIWKEVVNGALQKMKEGIQ